MQTIGELARILAVGGPMGRYGVWVFFAACGGMGLGDEVPTEDEEASRTAWQAELLPDAEVGLHPQIFRRRSGGFWIAATTEGLSYDIDCGRGSLEEATLNIYEGRFGSWSRVLATDYASSAVAGEARPALAIDPDGNLWVAYPEGSGLNDWDYCGPTAVRLQKLGGASAGWVSGEFRFNPDGVTSESYAVGSDLSLSFGADGTRYASQQRVILGRDQAQVRTHLDLLRRSGSEEVDADPESGRFGLVLPDRPALELLSADAVSLFSYREVGTGWARTTLGEAPQSRPDIAVLPDGSRLGAYVDRNGAALQLEDAGDAWVVSELDLPATPASAIAVDAYENHVAMAFSDGQDVYLILDGPDGRWVEPVPRLVDRDCYEADVAISREGAHLAMHCAPDAEYRTLVHAWRPLPER